MHLRFAGKTGFVKGQNYVCGGVSGSEGKFLIHLRPAPINAQICDIHTGEVQGVRILTGDNFDELLDGAVEMPE